MAHIHEKIDFTVAIFVVHDGKILLIHHRKLDKWLPLGGHIELDEDPEQAALREAKEESGLDVELLGERPPTTSPGTRALIAPRFLDIHRINDTHEHIGMIYWARPKERQGSARHRGASRHPLVRRDDLDKLSPPMTDAVKWYCRQAIEEISRASERRQKFRAVCFTIEGLNSFATVIYFNYLYFLLPRPVRLRRQGTTSRSPRCIGLIYTFASWQAGRFAQRCGNFTALKIGFGVMAAGLVVGSQLHSAGRGNRRRVRRERRHVFHLAGAGGAGQRGRDTAARAVGIYNITWAAANAAAYFIGGTLIEKFGYQSMFYLPLVFIARATGAGVLARKNSRSRRRSKPVICRRPTRTGPRRRAPKISSAWRGWRIRSPTSPSTRSRRACRASPRNSSCRRCWPGFVCSLWCFVRLGAFVLLWRWPGWHYRFRWLVTAFALLIAVVRGHSDRAQPGRAGRGADFFRRGHRADLLFVAVLLDGRERHQERARRHPRGGHRRGQLHRPGGRRGGAAVRCRKAPTPARIAVSGLLLCGLGGLVTIWKTAR